MRSFGENSADRERQRYRDEWQFIGPNLPRFSGKLARMYIRRWIQRSIDSVQRPKMNQEILRGHDLNRYSSCWHFLTILSSFGAHTGGSHMDQNLLSLYIVQLADIDQTSPHPAQSGHYLKRYSSFWHFSTILVSFWGLTGGSHMDENFLSL